MVMAIPHAAHAPAYEYLLPPVLHKRSTCIHCRKPIVRVAMFEFDHEESELDMSGLVHDAIVAIERVQKSRIWFEPHSDVLDTILEAKDALQILAGYDAVTAAGGDSMTVRHKRYQPTSFDRLRLPEPSPHRTTGTRG